MPRSLAQRRYVWRVSVAMTLYVVTLFAAEYLIDDQGVAGPAAWVLALLPGICVAAVFWALGRLLIEEQDEYLRVLLVRQLLVASGVTLTVATIWGFLENFELVPHVDAFYLAILFFVAQGFGAVVNKLTVGDSGSC
jgi:hypothetical protein